MYQTVFLGSLLCQAILGVFCNGQEPNSVPFLHKHGVSIEKRIESRDELAKYLAALKKSHSSLKSIAGTIRSGELSKEGDVEVLSLETFAIANAKVYGFGTAIGNLTNNKFDSVHQSSFEARTVPEGILELVAQRELNRTLANVIRGAINGFAVKKTLISDLSAYGPLASLSLENPDAELRRSLNKFFPWSGILDDLDGPFSNFLKPTDIKQGFTGQFKNETCIIMVASGKLGDIALAFCPDLNYLTVALHRVKNRDSIHRDKLAKDYNIESQTWSMHVELIDKDKQLIKCKINENLLTNKSSSAFVYRSFSDFNAVTFTPPENSFTPKVEIENGTTILHSEDSQIKWTYENGKIVKSSNANIIAEMENSKFIEPSNGNAWFDERYLFLACFSLTLIFVVYFCWKYIPR